MRAILRILLVFSVGLVTGCDLTGVLDREGDRSKASAVLGPGLKVQLSAPDVVAVGDSFEVRFTAKNHTGEDLVLTTGNSCLVEPGIFLDGERREFIGSVVGCLDVTTHHKIPDGRTEKQVFDVQALRWASLEEGPEPVDPGLYTIKLEFEATLGRSLKNGDVVEAVLRRDLRVFPVHWDYRPYP